MHRAVSDLISNSWAVIVTVGRREREAVNGERVSVRKRVYDRVLEDVAGINGICSARTMASAEGDLARTDFQRITYNHTHASRNAHRGCSIHGYRLACTRSVWGGIAECVWAIQESEFNRGDEMERKEDRRRRRTNRVRSTEERRRVTRGVTV